MHSFSEAVDSNPFRLWLEVAIILTFNKPYHELFKTHKMFRVPITIVSV